MSDASTKPKQVVKTTVVFVYKKKKVLAYVMPRAAWLRVTGEKKVPLCVYIAVIAT